MTLNVGNGLAEPRRLAEVVYGSGADVIGLQELAAAQAEILSRDVSTRYPSQVLIPSGFTGKGLLSRVPVVSHELLDLHPERPDLRALVDFAGLRVQVLVAHPPPPQVVSRRLRFDARALAQFESLAGILLARPPSVLLGDLNMSSRNPIYAQFEAAGLHDAFAAAGFGRGWTLPKRLGHSTRLKHGLERLPLRPVMRVDYIWTTGDVSAAAAWVGEDAGSDHLPVLADLDMPRA
jgi:endonuclease/exonuclease/phosphatase family metal-dependent hydrolase